MLYAPQIEEGMDLVIVTSAMNLVNMLGGPVRRPWLLRVAPPQVIFLLSWMVGAVRILAPTLEGREQPGAFGAGGRVEFDGTVELDGGSSSRMEGIARFIGRVMTTLRFDEPL